MNDHSFFTSLLESAERTEFSAANFTELKNGTNPKFHLNAQLSKVFGVVSRRGFRRFKFLVKSREVYSSKVGHLVSFIYPAASLSEMYVDQGKHTLHNRRVKVWCSCKAWQYWGPAYNSTVGGYNFEHSEDRPPEIRDPGRTNLVCKHVLATVRHIKGYNFKRLIDTFMAAYSSAEMKRIKNTFTREKKMEMMRELFNQPQSQEKVFQGSMYLADASGFIPMSGEPQLYTGESEDELELEEPLELEGFVPFFETLPIVAEFLQRNGYSEDQILRITSKLDEENFDAVCAKLGIIAQLED